MARRKKSSWFPIFILGALAGLALDRLVLAPEKDQMRNKDQDTSLVANPVATSSWKKHFENLKNVPTKSNLIVTEERPVPRHEKSFAAQQLINLRLEEESISQMEQDWEDLREHAFTTPTADGWKVHLKGDDHLFSRLGIHDGDVITYDSIRNQIQESDKAYLANRMIDILNQIEQ